MIPIILEGLLLGLGLAVSLGPIFIALTQTSMEEGRLPGLTVGSGIWTSDILIVLLFFNFINSIKLSIESEGFKFYLGISGAVVLIGFGVYLIMKPARLNFQEKKHDYKNYIGFWMKGFLVNTVNPFTFFFWMSVISTYVIGREVSPNQGWVLLTTILIIIVVSDVLKVFLADLLKKRLTHTLINQVSNFSGIIMVLFGVFMFYRVI